MNADDGAMEQLTLGIVNAILTRAFFDLPIICGILKVKQWTL